jgi:hypothetical protein
VRAPQQADVVEQLSRLLIDDCGREGVAVRHADVGASTEREPARAHRGGQSAEPHDIAAEGPGLVDRPVNAGAAFAGRGEQVARPKGTSTTCPTKDPPMWDQTRARSSLRPAREWTVKAKVLLTGCS